MLTAGLRPLIQSGCQSALTSINTLPSQDGGKHTH